MATPSSPRTLDAYAIAAPGLEPLVARELTSLGMVPNEDAGGVAFRGSLEVIERANLWLRTASRVIIRVGAFRARAFHELERSARAIPWERYVASGAAVRFRVTSRKSRLYHTDAIAQRLGEAVEHRLGSAIGIESAGAEEGDDDVLIPAQMFVVRVVQDQFTVSADSSGALLHQRGYRRVIAKAPVRETLAAAMLIAANWSGTTPLIDPLCGSGTIPIEGALIARRIAPGLLRPFAFQSWPSFEAASWDRLRAEAGDRALPRSPVLIRGSDRDAGAIESAISNAARAGVAADIEFSARAVSSIDDCVGPTGLVAANPPYGVRVGEAARLRDLYARFGQVLRAKCPGWQLALLSANGRLERELRLPLEEQIRTRNGGIPVRLLKATIPDRGRPGAGVKPARAKSTEL